jgi:hypothetical protein
MFNYIIFTYGEYGEQDEIVCFIAEHISNLLQFTSVKYNYGNCGSIFTFKSNNDINICNDLLKDLFTDFNFTYVLLPYSLDNVAENFLKPIYKHLFTDDDNVINDTINNTMFYPDLPDLPDWPDLDNTDDYYYIDNDTGFLHSTKQVPTLNGVLDKILNDGINSLTTNEKNFLDEYSKSI